MKIKILLVFIGLVLLVAACTPPEKTCVIKGKVINRPKSTHLRLTKAFEDSRSRSVALIPIQDGSFHYEINYTDVEAYTLIFEDEYKQGRSRPIIFFTTNGTLEMELYPMEDHAKNLIEGGEDNQQFAVAVKLKMDEVRTKTKQIRDSLQVLQNSKNYFSPSGEGLSVAAKRLVAKNDSVMRMIEGRGIERIASNLTIPNYYLLIQAIRVSKYATKTFNFDELSALQKRYASKFKKHVYTKYSNEILWSMENMKPGGDFFDFTLPDFNEREYTLSDEIKGKYALINIWAPWCGSCISKSRDMKTVFEDYKDRGFTVVSVASKYEEIGKVEKLLEKEQHPWLTLIDKPELDSRLNEHYGIEKAGGTCILVDKAGKVVLVSPEAAEVRQVLEANL
ncbi:TlpA disulfide reductase family protein [uncultured Sunxiuqinia sp.]|uniref:peroxiredoxin family protein n=1 Tax=uncultured Sunxiuqinia sp. TaxID=1573825 RepID=UPI002610BE8D|nr:TlpA disulfide reductase family protein [uncultured Sunxiuqinia sp.]